MIGKASVVSVFLVCSAVSLCAAEPAPKKQDLGAWWHKNALEFDPMPAQWLHHAEGTFSYMNASGNTSGSTFDIAGSAEFRKGRFTSNTFVELGRRNMVYGFNQGSVDYVERTLREQVDWAVAKRMKLVAGIEAYRNTLMFMDRRLNKYGGLGAVLLDNDKQQVTFTGGLGHASFLFDREGMMGINPAAAASLNTSPGSGGGLGLQTWHWNVHPRFNFSQDASYMQYFDSYLGHRWTINLNGNFPLDKRFSFNVTYRFKEEANTIIDALGLSPRDRMFLMGIKVSI